MSQVATNYDSLLYPKHASNTETILPKVLDSSVGPHISAFGSKSVGGTRKHRTDKKGTIIRRKLRRARKTNRRKKSSRRYK
jgi:hypothetical protein